MAPLLALSPYLTGDPVPLGAEVTTTDELGGALGLPGLDAGLLLRLAPGAVLVPALAAAAGPLTLRWFRLPHAPVLTPAIGPVEVAIALSGPIAEAGRAVRLVAKLAACCADAAFLDRTRSAGTREELVRVLAAIEPTAGERRLPTEALLALLTTTAAGLSADEAARRLAAAGPNRLERLRRRPLAARLLEQFWSFFAVLLWVGGALAFLAGMPELGWAIFAVIVVNGVFGFLQEYRAERAVEALQELLPRQITVLRGSAEPRVSTAELVPGDVVRLEEGVQVPADGQLLEAASLRVDQGALTGESQPVAKRPLGEDDPAPVPPVERPELVFAGTSVMSGSATYLVTATGMATEIGAIAHLTQAVVEEPSPLQREMARVTRIVTMLAVAFGGSFFGLGVATGTLGVHEGLVFALGVIVANVPEGLLPTLTLALALGVQRMARQRTLLKRLSAVETLGATTVMCTDKTGTLTQNRLAARAVWVSGRLVHVGVPGGPATAEVGPVLEAAALASQATGEHGDPTEIALVLAARQAGIDGAAARAARPLVTAHPFDSFRKRMTLVRRTDGGTAAYVKGAPKETLGLCDTACWDGQVVPLTEARRRAILADHDRLATQGLRLLAVAIRPLPAGLPGAGPAAVERELTFLGLVALWDPPRPEVKEAIAVCRRAGIRVVVVTGDYGLTAQAIAREIGLPVERVVTGEEVERLALEERAAKIREHGLATRWLLRTGVPHDAIVKAASEEGADYLVIGTHGRGGLERVFLGSVADRVVRTAPCPVVTVRQPEA